MGSFVMPVTCLLNLQESFCFIQSSKKEKERYKFKVLLFFFYCNCHDSVY